MSGAKAGVLRLDAEETEHEGLNPAGGVQQEAAGTEAVYSVTVE